MPTLLQKFITSFSHIPTHTYRKPENNNLKPHLRSALHTLSHNQDIVIKPADKGALLVIQNKTDYIQESLRQLSNPAHYTTLPGPLHPTTIPRVNKILQDLQNKQFITDKQAEYLSPPTTPRPRLFYTLPKIHKPPDSWPVPHRIPPGRPIVSDCSSDTYQTAEFIDHYLQPLSTSHPSYIKDTYHFLDLINNLKIPPQSYLISLDVDSMYTNIDNNMGLQAVQSTFLKHPDPHRPDQQLLQLLRINLECNDFHFLDRTYLQISGTAMGKKFAPAYANIVAAHWEEEALSHCPLQPFFYKRYLDDIFIIWHHDLPSFHNFFQILNTSHPSMRLKHTIQTQSIDFLDITLHKGPRFHTSNILDTKVFFKATDKHLLLHKLSFHPPHTFKGVLKSQILRFHRLSSDQQSFNNSCSILFQALRSRGYTARFLRSIKSKTIRDLTPVMPHQTGPHPCSSPQCQTCQYLLPIPTVTSSDNKTFPIPHSLSCSDSSVIYAITCTSCSLVYIGQTGNSLRDRHNAHKSDILTKKDTPISRHFNLPNHSLLNYKITPLEQITGPNPKNQRLIKEISWITKLKSITPLGLNTISSTSSPQILPLVIPYSSTAVAIAQQAKTLFNALQNQLPTPFSSYQLIISYKRRKNLQDTLVSAKLPNYTPPTGQQPHTPAQAL